MVYRDKSVNLIKTVKGVGVAKKSCNRGISDHFPISVKIEIDIRVKNEKLMIKRLRKTATATQVLKYLQASSWPQRQFNRDPTNDELLKSHEASKMALRRARNAKTNELRKKIYIQPMTETIMHPSY